ncbi:serine/arginine repetitive matrix protein 2-like [Mus caroli]|uniref:Serine/arginine repetitive matrix protein 2-like n=1 Tax=Mus caroli TaxID=10089 RepID=A0A6P7RCQ9_MUSCR|nr:serine/arginine repetitive matrix protein 2-like [Mus caroli]
MCKNWIYLKVVMNINGEGWLSSRAPARSSQASSHLGGLSAPGLSLRRRVRPTSASPGQGSARVSAISPVRPGPGRLSPPGHSGPWTPASGDGRGPGRPPPRRQGLQRSASPTRGAGSRPTCRGRAGTDAGGLRPASAARRGVARTWLSPQHQAIAAAAILPSTPCRRRRRRRPPRVSRMWAFPGVACAGAEDWGLQAAPLGPGASAPFVASRPRLTRSPASLSWGECSPESGVCTTRFWLCTETRARRGERGSHQERAVNGAPRPRTSRGKMSRA